MHLPLFALAMLRIPPQPVPPQPGQTGSLLHVQASPIGERWELSLLLQLVAPPEIPPPLGRENVRIDMAGGVGPAPLVVESVAWVEYPWRIAVIVAPLTDGGRWTRPVGEFALTLSLPGLIGGGRDAAPFRLAVPEAGARPADTLAMNYLVKDYNGFRSDILRHMSVYQPAWTDRSPADVGITVIESLAYVADYASQYQDAVAAEAYLTTARLRRSLRRHARLLDYRTDDGCNARAWVQVKVRRYCHLAAGSLFVTTEHETSVATPDDPAVTQVINNGAPAFESMRDAELCPSLNDLTVYEFGGRGQTLPRGARHAILAVRKKAAEWLLAAPMRPWSAPGALLAFDQMKNGGPDGDTQIVRIIEARDITAQVEPTAESPEFSVIAVRWAAADAFALPMVSNAAERRFMRCRGNLVLVDLGRTVQGELPPVDPNLPYRPTVNWGNLVMAPPLPAEVGEPTSAAALMDMESADPIPAISLQEDLGAGIPGARWRVRRDLLDCLPDERAFVVELDSDGYVTLRFGDGVYGRRPPPLRPFKARFRVGSGGPASIAHSGLNTLVAPPESLGALRAAVVAIETVNHAVGERRPEPDERIRVRAPEAWRQPISCATLDDFAKAAMAVDGVGEAMATVDGAGTRIHVTARSGEQLWTPPDLLARVQTALNGRCLAGRSVVVRAPTLVPLEVILRVTLAEGAREGHVRAALARAFEPTGQGFFSAGSVRMGGSVFASALVARALAVPGVVGAHVARLARAGWPAADAPPAALMFGDRELPLVSALTDDGSAGWLRIDVRGAP